MLLLALMLAGSAASHPPVRLQVQPKIAQAPADIHIKVIIERNPKNRWIEIVADGENFRRSSLRQLDGEDAPAVFDIWWPALPCGHYIAQARLTRTDGASAARETFTLIGFGCEAP